MAHDMEVVPAQDRKTVFVVGLGMVGIGEWPNHSMLFVRRRSLFPMLLLARTPHSVSRHKPAFPPYRWLSKVDTDLQCLAFIEKLLNLDERQEYRIITCGEEMHRE